jgi:putative modified peptide
MAQRNVEALIGRLATDEEFRARFRSNARAAVVQTGLTLTPTEIDALLQTDPSLWDQVAAAIDPRLQKIALAADDPASR